MKPERISIFNYEAFYLDHLEGNLGGEDTALLLAFLEENPELKMDDEELPVFEMDDYQLTQMEKLELKQSDENEPIVLNNAEYFMIAESEGLLSDQKISELDVLITHNPELEKDRNYFGAVTIKPDLNVLYDDKEGLKRKGVNFWPYIVMAAAASVLIAFFLLTNDQFEETSSHATIDKEVPSDKTEKEEENNLTLYAEDKNEVAADVANVNSNDKLVAQIHQSIPAEGNYERSTIASLKKRDARTLVHSLEGFELQPISRTLPNISENEINNGNDIASTGYEYMTDPIQGVTSRINRRIKPEVEFKTAKATETQGGGFFLKVGRFEFMRKKHK